MSSDNQNSEHKFSWPIISDNAGLSDGAIKLIDDGEMAFNHTDYFYRKCGYKLNKDLTISKLNE